MGPSKIQDECHEGFLKVFTEMPQLRSQEGNVEKIENTSEMNP